VSAPLVVNTKDGTCWTRRGSFRGGEALYAPEGVCRCPEFVMATLAELAEHGIAGTADALPVPGGQPPLAVSEQQIEALAAAGNRVVNDAVHQHLCMCDAWPDECVSTGNYYMGAWDVPGLEDAIPAVLALWERMRGGELGRLSARVVELEALLREATAGEAVADDLYKALQGRVAELETERHSTNEALSDAAEQLRAIRDRIAELEAQPTTGDFAKWLRKKARECPTAPERQESAAEAIARLADKVSRGALRPAVASQAVREEDVAPQVEKLRTLLAGQRDAVAAEADGFTRRIAPVQALRVDHSSWEDPHDGPLARKWSTPHDLDLPKAGVTVPGACKACGSAPDTWCPDCAACHNGCYDGFVDNPCTHANASWGGGA
jgi:hypothetical protein